MSDHTPPAAQAASPPPPRRPALAWVCLANPSPALARCSRITLLAARGVFQVFRWAHAASGNPPLWAFGGPPAVAFFFLLLLKLQLRAGRRATPQAMLAADQAQIAICEIADPHPLQHGKRTPGNDPLPCRPWIVCPLLFSTGCGGLPAACLWAGPRLRPACSSAHSQHATHTNAGPRHRRRSRVV